MHLLPGYGFDVRLHEGIGGMDVRLSVSGLHRVLLRCPSCLPTWPLGFRGSLLFCFHAQSEVAPGPTHLFTPWSLCQSGFSRETEPIRHRYRYRYIDIHQYIDIDEIYYERLTYAVMEAEKYTISCLQAGGSGKSVQFHYKPEVLRTSGAMV